MKIFKSVWIIAALGAFVVGSASAVAAPELPKGLKWETNTTDPIFASPNAKRGGTFNTAFMTYPMTLRFVGPDSNGSFRSAILGNVFGAITLHPNTGNIIPVLAESWAFGDDHKSMYFKINPKAKWSDGTPVTAQDFEFTLKFMLSPHIKAPWYNTYYTEKYDKIVVYDKHTFGILGKQKKSKIELVSTFDIPAMPKHWFKGEVPKDYVKSHNWKIMPNVGPYIITQIKKGKSITFTRKKDWWGDNERFFKYRFNPDKMYFKLVRDINIAYEMFKKGQLEAFGLTLPEYWHDKAKGPIFDKGYVKKLWFYLDAPQPDLGIWLNQDVPLFKDKNVRLLSLDRNDVPLFFY